MERTHAKYAKLRQEVIKITHITYYVLGTLPLTATVDYYGQKIRNFSLIEKKLYILSSKRSYNIVDWTRLVL